MCPVIVKIGPIAIYGYGLMLAIGFLIGSYFVLQEFKRRGIPVDHANTITLIAIVAGIAGSKLLFLIENWSDFTADPFGMAFSASGLTYYGGFFLATLFIYLYIKKKGLHFFTIADAMAPALMLAYGVARIGCHLAGDGDYGFPTSLPWGTDYSKGTYPPSYAFRDFPEITSQYPHGIVPDTTPCHPTPIYEFLICSVMFLYLWNIRKSTTPPGKLFMIYLILAGAERFTIEFIRINPRILLGLTEAQIISIFLILAGAFGIRIINERKEINTSNNDNRRA
ncbi:MAG: prolipoprotein diacylglyceryl transferase [Bacteroidetes bacterium]|nr:prolipoprotein diacylglyceryl transferase [Bacteroidota bacterium]